MAKYIVSKHPNRDVWYVHRVGFPQMPMLGSGSKTKRAAQRLAAIYNNTIDLRKKEDRI